MPKGSRERMAFFQKKKERYVQSLDMEWRVAAKGSKGNKQKVTVVKDGIPQGLLFVMGPKEREIWTKRGV